MSFEGAQGLYSTGRYGVGRVGSTVVFGAWTEQGYLQLTNYIQKDDMILLTIGD